MNKKDQKTNGALSKSGDYVSWLKELKAKIRSTQIRAALAANLELIVFYWELGEDISRKLEVTNWGAKVIDQLSRNLRSEFPDMQGFSRMNLYYVKKFYDVFSAFWNDPRFVPPTGGQSLPAILHQVGGQLPWSHITWANQQLTYEYGIHQLIPNLGTESAA